MSNALIQNKKKEGEREITLRLLEHLTREGGISQDRFAKQIGIAKGLANAYFNRCLQKGWIKLRQVPRQRYLYYLTPKGFIEKARLTAEFLASSYEFYRTARGDFAAVITEACKNGHNRLAVIGAGELAEIVAITSEEFPVEIIGFVEGKSARQTLAKRPVVESLSDLNEVDAVLIATLQGAHEAYGMVRRNHPNLIVYVPRCLAALVEVKI